MGESTTRKVSFSSENMQEGLARGTKKTEAIEKLWTGSATEDFSQARVLLAT